MFKSISNELKKWWRFCSACRIPEITKSNRSWLWAYLKKTQKVCKRVCVSVCAHASVFVLWTLSTYWRLLCTVCTASSSVYRLWGHSVRHPLPLLTPSPHTHTNSDCAHPHTYQKWMSCLRYYFKTFNPSPLLHSVFKLFSLLSLFIFLYTF